MDLLNFQKRFIRGALGADTAALSIPRGNGKSWLAAHVLKRCLTPGDPLNVPGAEYLLAAGSIEQARLCFRFIRADLEPTGQYRFLDSSTRIGIAGKKDNTRLRVLSSKAKTAFGIVGCPLLVADEPGSWETVGGQLMHDAVQTAMGKPGSPLQVIYIGTLAPSSGGWWHQLVRSGSRGSTFVQALQGDPKTWDEWPTIRKANPLTAISPEFRKKLLEERDDAREDTRLKARFCSYRLNVPSGDESTMLLDVDDWERVCARPVPPREGRPFVGYDLGGGRAWSAATAIFKSGRVEAMAVCPGIPSIEEQEKRDRVPGGTYRNLVNGGRLRIAAGLRVQPPGQLHKAVLAEWGRPVGIVCDRFRLPELQDCVRGTPLVPRVARWSEAAADIRALRSMAKDGPLAVSVESRALLTASLAAAMVENDSQGSTRLIKRDPHHNTGRDDVAAALTLCAGRAREWMIRKSTGVYLGKV